jgi:hypothetical protein
MTACQQLRVTTLERDGEKRKASPSAAELNRVAPVQLRCSTSLRRCLLASRRRSVLRSRRCGE